MAIKLPSMSETREFAVALFKAFFPDRNVGTKRSYHSRRLTVLAAVATQIHRHIQSAADDCMPDTASDDGPIDRWGGIVGKERKGATSARKSTALRVRGTLASTADIGEELVHQASQLRFELASFVTIPAGLFVDADVIALDTGTATRLDAGEVLEFVSTPPGIETQATLQKDIDEDGFDEEQYGAYRKRVLDTFAEPSAGGNASDFEAWALEIDGIAQAFVYPNRAGFGTMDVAVLHTGSGSARIPNSGTRATALAYLKTKAPAHIAGAGGALRILIPVADPKVVEIRILPDGDASNAFDWDDAVSPTVLAWNGTTRELQFSGGALPASLKAGHRLSFGSVASVQDGTEFTIESLSAVDKVILASVPAVAPVATDIIYSGGPLVTPIRSAILGHINGELVYAAKGGVPKSEGQLAAEDKTTVGLEVIAEGMGTANPNGIYGTWNGSLVGDSIRKIAMAKGGVRKTSLTLPAADYDAQDFAFPNDGNIGLITATSVLVRKL
jgi:uncharacterized phage protein gp47/JayE